MLTQARLKEVLHYEPSTGVFTWRVVPRVKTGARAGCQTSQGYRRIIIDRQAHSEHRLAWLYMTGVWPLEIDHIDLDKSNNIWINLRLADRSKNSANVLARKRNKSGFKGVSWNGKRWGAWITYNYKSIYLGSFDTPQVAAAAYQAKAAQLFGQFARA